MVFKLSESAMVEGIEQVAKNWKNLALSSAAGLIQFSFQEEPQALADAIIEAYYRTPHG